MVDLLSLVDEPAIPSSIDTIYAGSSAPLARTAAGLRGILRRMKSGGYPTGFQNPRKSVTPDESEDEDELARGRSSSPVRANSKRRRSAVTTPCPGVLNRSLSEVSRRTASPPVRSELSLHDQGGSPRSISRTLIQYRAASSQRSPSRGRTWRRDDTPHPGNSERGKNRQHDKRSNISRQRLYTQGGRISLEQSEYSSSPSPSSSNVTALVQDTLSYVPTRAFRLHIYMGSEEFRFPKPASQPEPTWCPGDGFSDDEVKPDFAFLMTGKRKRKRSRSLSAFGQLSLETENTGNDSAAGATSGQLHLRGSHGYGGRARRTEVKDLWPTRENFAEHSIAKKPRNAGVRNHGTIESTPPFNPRCPPMSKPQTKQAMPRKRQVSDFENFGKRKGKPRSCHREGPSLKSTPVSQGYVSEVSDEENNEDRGGLYEQAGHESEQQSVADEELEDIRMTVHELESNDNGSVRLGEDNSDDEDENMQNTISDSQPEEVPSSKFGIGERLEAYLTNLARRSLSNYEATAENTTLDSQVDKAPSSSFDVGEGPVSVAGSIITVPETTNYKATAFSSGRHQSSHV